MPRDAAGEAETLQWVVAALNSIEMVTVPWWFLKISGQGDNGLADWMEKRLAQLETVLNEREWLVAGRFTAADLIMADVLRVPDVRARGDRPATKAYVKGLLLALPSAKPIRTRSRILRRPTKARAASLD